MCPTTGTIGVPRTATASTARTLMPKPFARSEMARPVPPNPTMPIVNPESSKAARRIGTREPQASPLSVSAGLSDRASASSKAKA